MALGKIIGAAERWAGRSAEVHRPSPIVSTQDNYDRLYYECDAVARSSRYTHYVDEHRILRTHTSSAIPSLLESRGERLIAVPGLVYRRDVMDRMHVGEPHQVDLWLTRPTHLGRRDLLSMIEAILAALLPQKPYRCNETQHPYTSNGLEVEVLVGDRWVEVLECGEIRPDILRDAGYGPEWGGLAMGLGLDRAVMLLKGLDDIRLLRSTDPRVASQMRDLTRYRHVSSQPAIRRDLSLVVSDPDMEIIGDRIRSALGERAEWVEEVVELSRTGHDALPEHVRARIGIEPQQTNLLLRVVLRALDRSIPGETANEVYDLIYEELHENRQGYRRTT